MRCGVEKEKSIKNGFGGMSLFIKILCLLWMFLCVLWIYSALNTITQDEPIAVLVLQGMLLLPGIPAFINYFK